MKTVLLVCGSGASSGFMAANVRRAASSRKMEINIFARSDSEIVDYIETIDILLVGPHLAYMVDSIEEITKKQGVPVYVIPQGIYGSLDGNKLLDFILDKLGGTKNG